MFSNKFIVAICLLSLFFFAAPLISAQKGTTTRIEIFDDAKDLSNSELRRKVRRLQDAVIDLQERVERLEEKLGTTPSSNTTTTTTCYIETPFDGVFDATDSNETKARIEAVKSCISKVKSRIHCSAEKVKCGK